MSSADCTGFLQGALPSPGSDAQTILDLTEFTARPMIMSNHFSPQLLLDHCKAENGDRPGHGLCILSMQKGSHVLAPF